jgi:hypothetical protein
MKPATSESICAASANIANEPEIIPPANSQPMKMKQIKDTKHSFYIALFPSSSFLMNFLSFLKAQELGKV